MKYTDLVQMKDSFDFNPGEKGDALVEANLIGLGKAPRAAGGPTGVLR